MPGTGSAGIVRTTSTLQYGINKSSCVGSPVKSLAQDEKLRRCSSNGLRNAAPPIKTRAHSGRNSRARVQPAEGRRATWRPWKQDIFHPPDRDAALRKIGSYENIVVTPRARNRGACEPSTRATSPERTAIPRGNKYERQRARGM